MLGEYGVRGDSQIFVVHSLPLSPGQACSAQGPFAKLGLPQRTAKIAPCEVFTTLMQCAQAAQRAKRDCCSGIGVGVDGGLLEDMLYTPTPYPPSPASLRDCCSLQPRTQPSDHTQDHRRHDADGHKPTHEQAGIIAHQVGLPPQSPQPSA
jgi:hypothetical protein